MPVDFAYHKPTESIDFDIPNGTKLTAEEAQVIATVRVGDLAEEIAGALKDILELAYKELDRALPMK
jgi:hypothetical protein